ncbi:MAG TPA: polysaccharide pyruvyl transferase family protein [Steroidobacteraceae bacterium]|nr:polysaccharide pyruvyl transferase family protein [Steroidobacteraceae bacterium]
MIWASPRAINGNRGDIASRFGILAGFAKHGARFSVILAARPDHVPELLRPQVIQNGPLYNLWPGFAGLRALRRARAVAWCAGLDLQDDSSRAKLVHLWLLFAFYRLLGLRIMLVFQGAGPLTTHSGRWLARRVTSLVELALIRDSGSFHLLEQFVEPKRLRLAADGIFLEGFPTRDALGACPAPILALTNASGRPVIGINLRLWFHFTNSWLPHQFATRASHRRAQHKREALVESMTEVVAHLRRHHRARVVLISMYEPRSEPWEDDCPLLMQLKSRFVDDPEVVLWQEDVPIEDLFRLFGRLDLMIGMRLHSALIAMRAGVPAIHLAYTLKGRDIYADLGLREWAIELEEVSRAPAAVTRVADAVLADPDRFARVATLTTRIVAENQRALCDAIRSFEDQ